MTNRVLGWHFAGATLRDGRPLPADGEPLVHTGRAVMCESGLHFSTRLIDALRYAPGPIIHRVVGERIVQRDKDKVLCRQRTILWRVDGDALLREFARMCALDVIDTWDPPEIVVEYLITGDESLRDAARDAAWAAGDAARAAAWAAAWVAAQTAAGAAGDAARAAGDAAWAAAWVAARAAARDAARTFQNRRLVRLVMAARREAA
jgi:hypothetical protein